MGGTPLTCFSRVRADSTARQQTFSGRSAGIRLLSGRQLTSSLSPGKRSAPISRSLQELPELDTSRV